MDELFEEFACIKYTMSTNYTTLNNLFFQCSEVWLQAS